MDSKKNAVRVGVYCHAAKDTDGQKNHVDSLEKSYISIVNRKPGWTLSGIYAEDPVAGRKKKRPQFLRLMEDCNNGLIDCIICRSVSIFIRFDRKEIPYIRHLQGLGIRLIFKEDGVESGDDVFELLITVLEALAEGKYRSVSENNTIKMRENALNGTTCFSVLYGFRGYENIIKIEPEEAKTVRQIFDYYEHGLCADEIARILSDKKIPTPRGNSSVWQGSVIRAMIENEKYVGDYDALRIIVSRQSEDCGENRIQSTVYHKDHHPAIISREQFERCGVISNLRKFSTPLQYPFGEYLRCPYCGHILFRRRTPTTRCYCCEGEEACRRFVISVELVERAILGAYENVDIKAVLKKAGMRDYSIAIEAETLLRTKDRIASFKRIDYWWLDDLVEKISFGLHTSLVSGLKAGAGNGLVEDRTVRVYWRCGVVTTVFSGVNRDSSDPRRRAEKWDEYILSHPEEYPQLVEEIQKKNKL